MEAFSYAEIYRDMRKPKIRDQEVGGSNPLAPTNFP